MVQLAVGDVVVVPFPFPFPFSDLSTAKKRPALVVALTENGDVIFCQITSRAYSARAVIPIENADFATGSLPTSSFVRPRKLFTASQSIAIAVLGTLAEGRLHEVRAAIVKLFGNSEPV